MIYIGKMKLINRILCLIIFLLLWNTLLKAQNSYRVLFSTELDERVIQVSRGYEDETVILIMKNYWGGVYDTSHVARINIYSFYTNLEDSLRWPVNFNRTDTTIFPSAILFDSSSYVLSGEAVVRPGGVDSLLERYQYIARYNLDKQVVWEYLYPWPEEVDQYSGPGMRKIIKLITGDYFTIAYVSKIGQPIEKWLIQTYSPEGDLLKTRIFSDYLAGYLESLTYNYDSSELLVHATEAHTPGCNHLHTAGVGAVRLDTITYDTVGGVCYLPDITIQHPYQAQFNPAGNLILTGATWIFDFELHKMDEYIGIYVLDTNYEVTDSRLLTDKDRKVLPGEFKCMDIDSSGNIYIAGILDWVADFWPQVYDYIYVAKLDSNLNLLAERYFGGDAYYWVSSVMATQDGGMAIGGMQYDYNVNNYEYDAFFIKTNPDLWVNVKEQNAIPVHSAVVYPNPGSGKMTVRTTEKGSLFVLYNLSGKNVFQKRITQLITETDCSTLAEGVYLWKLIKNGREIDHGKWVKIK